MSITKQCAVCLQTLTCTSASGHCWCMDYPTLLTVEANTDCLCERCLKQRIVKQIDDYCSTITLETAVKNTIKDFSRSTGLIEDIDYYIENGLYVFTKWFHLKRGACCKNGCRHCPYGYEK